MKKILIFSCIAVAISCKRNSKEDNTPDASDSTAVETPAVSSKLLIEPGNRIGQVVLETDAQYLESIVGKPDLSDSAMGKSWMTWFSKVRDSVTGHELNVYTTYKDNTMTEKVVRQIRITSGEFQTAGRIHTGSSLAEVKKQFPGLVEVGAYDTETPNPTDIYDAVDQGIAFEFEGQACTGIIVHTKGHKVSEEYMTFHPDMKPM